MIQARDQVVIKSKDDEPFDKKGQSTIQMFEQFYRKPFAEITQDDIGSANEINWGDDVGIETI